MKMMLKDGVEVEEEEEDEEEDEDEEFGKKSKGQKSHL